MPSFSSRFRAVFLGVLIASASFTGAVPVAVADSSADEHWQSIKQLQQELSMDAPKGTNQVEHSAPIKARLHDKAAEFSQAFPGDPRRWEADLIQVKTTYFPGPAKERETLFDENEKRVAAIQSAPDASAELRQNARRTILFQHLDHIDLLDKAQAVALEQRLLAYVRDFPADPKSASMQVRRADVLARIDPARVLPLLQELTRSEDAKVAAAANGRLAQRQLSETPLDWKFTALDGRTVDFAQLRGRIVLVDFWATWCPDCLRALPLVSAAYRKYHDQGVEIVGVSLDEDKDALTSFVAKRGLHWPEYYDGKGWQSEWVTKYGVGGIPEMWIIGKDGRVVAAGVQSGELDEQISQLLAK